jgi:hypothetical protein
MVEAGGRKLQVDEERMVAMNETSNGVSSSLVWGWLPWAGAELRRWCHMWRRQPVAGEGQGEAASA